MGFNLIPTRWADYAHCITACPPGFENLTASLYIEVLLTNKEKKIVEKSPNGIGWLHFPNFVCRAKPKWDWVVAFSLFLFDGLLQNKKQSRLQLILAFREGFL